MQIIPARGQIHIKTVPPNNKSPIKIFDTSCVECPTKNGASFNRVGGTYSRITY